MQRPFPVRRVVREAVALLAERIACAAACCRLFVRERRGVGLNWGRFANKRQKKIEGDDDVAAVYLTDDGRAATNDAVCVRAASGEVSEGGTRPRLLVGYLGYWRTRDHQNV